MLEYLANALLVLLGSQADLPRMELNNTIIQSCRLHNERW